MTQERIIRTGPSKWEEGDRERERVVKGEKIEKNPAHSVYSILTTSVDWCCDSPHLHLRVFLGRNMKELSLALQDNAFDGLRRVPKYTTSTRPEKKSSGGESLSLFEPCDVTRLTFDRQKTRSRDNRS